MKKKISVVILCLALCLTLPGILPAAFAEEVPLTEQEEIVPAENAEEVVQEEAQMIVPAEQNPNLLMCRDEEPFIELQQTDSVVFETDVMPSAAHNLAVSLRKYSRIVPVTSGYMRVGYDQYGTKKIFIEYYDQNFRIQKKGSLDLELPFWGGFYAGADAYYLIEGQSNTAEQDLAEVIRVIRYDKDWNRTGAASIVSNPQHFGGEVRYPFDYGCVECAEYNGNLFIVTGHEGYVDPAYNQGHQGFLMIKVDEASMTGEIVASDLWHSFAQYIEEDNGSLYVLEQSEGSRYTKVTKYDPETFTETEVPVLVYGGSRTSGWAIDCYASVDDLAVSSNNVLCIGTSIDQSNYDNVSENTAHNIYLTVTPKSNFTEDATQVKWLTSHNGDGASFLGLTMTKVSDDRFLVTWEEYTEEPQTITGTDTLSGSTLHYLFIDSNGNVISSEYTAAAPVSDCHPIIVGQEAVYSAANGNTANFYSINTGTGAFTKCASFRSAGDHATWTIQNGVLTVSGTGAVQMDGEFHYRYPLSSASHWFSYSEGAGPFADLSDKVEKLVVGDGITSIGGSAFAGLQNLLTAEIGSGVTAIGDRAFAYDPNLYAVLVPDSVKSFGEEVFYTGYTWVGSNEPVINATIYCNRGSAAAKYARKTGIPYLFLGLNLDRTKLSVPEGAKKSLYASYIRFGGSDTAPAYKWSSSDKSVATVNSNGVVTGIKQGTATITVKEKGTGETASCTVTVTKDIAGFSAKLSKKAFVYSGKANTPAVTLKDGTVKLKEGVDFTVTYSNNKKVGLGSAKITGKGLYSGTKTLTFQIKPVGTELKKVTGAAGSIKVKWKKQAVQTAGYQIQLATDKNFTKDKKTVTVKGYKKVSKKVTSLKGGKSYYVKIRTFKTIKGKKYYSKWSKVKTVTTIN